MPNTDYEGMVEWKVDHECPAWYTSLQVARVFYHWSNWWHNTRATRKHYLAIALARHKVNCDLYNYVYSTHGYVP